MTKTETEININEHNKILIRLIKMAKLKWIKIKI